MKDREGRWVIRHTAADYKVSGSDRHGCRLAANWLLIVHRCLAAQKPQLAPCRMFVCVLTWCVHTPACPPSAPSLQTGRAYGERPPLVLSPHLYPELEAYMGRWRAALEPRHNLLFSQ